MIQLLIDHPLLLLVIVSVLGYLLGQIEGKESRLGVAAVMFVGLGYATIFPVATIAKIILAQILLLL